jgi:hypothetical protein
MRRVGQVSRRSHVPQKKRDMAECLKHWLPRGQRLGY